jgi:surface polysaccharide O-acyltransferase-like enzyme
MNMIAAKPRIDSTLPVLELSKSRREMWPDIYRGTAIIAVIVIHCSGHVLSHLSPCNWNWYAVAFLNRFLQFAVPAFILVSTYLNGKSLTKENTSSAYFPLLLRRLKAIGLPYILASAAGTWLTDHGSKMSFSLVHFIKEMLLGRCAYHLYFIVIIVQLYLVLPFVVRHFRKPRNLAFILLGASAFQVTAYILNRSFLSAPALHDLRERYTSISVQSSLLWYLLPVGLGLWLLSNSFPKTPIKIPKYALYAAAVALVIYLPISVLSMTEPVNTILCQGAEWFYTAAAALLLVSLSVRIRHASWLASLGQKSLPIYLIHPFVIDALDMLCPSLQHQSPLFSLPVYLAATVALTLLLVKSASYLRSRFSTIPSYIMGLCAVTIIALPAGPLPCHSPMSTKTTGSANVLPKNASNICPIDINPEAFAASSHIMAEAADGRILIWNTNTWKIQSTVTAVYAGDALYSNYELALSPDGKEVAIQTHSGPRIFDCITGALISRITGYVVDQLAFTPDGSELVGESFRAESGCCVYVWDKSGRLLRTFAHAQAFGISPDSRELATIDAKNTRLLVWNIETAKLIQTIKSNHPIYSPIAFSPDGTMVAAGGEDPTFKGLPLYSPEDGVPSEAGESRQLRLNIWQLTTGKLMLSLPGLSNFSMNSQLLFSKDSKRIEEAGSCEEHSYILPSGKSMFPSRSYYAMELCPYGWYAYGIDDKHGNGTPVILDMISGRAQKFSIRKIAKEQI